MKKKQKQPAGNPGGLALIEGAERRLRQVRNACRVLNRKSVWKPKDLYRFIDKVRRAVGE